MSRVWRKIQRSNKKAAKYRFDCQLQELNIHCGRKWQPQKVAVAWVHRRRRYVTKDHQWEPSITDPYRGIIVWPPEDPALLEIVTTLYRDSRQETFDDKEWTFIVEGVSSRGKRKALAGISLNLRLFINELPGTQTELQLKLKPMCEHVDFATMKLVLSCQMLKEGNALDDDMQSVASAMSVSHQKSDIAEMADLDVSPGQSSHSITAASYQSPPTSPEDAQPKPLPQEIASIASEIADAWRPSRSPRRSPLAVTPPKVLASAPSPVAASNLPSTIASKIISVNETEGSRYPRTSWGTRDVPEKITPKSPRVADSLSELPSAGADLLSWCQAVTRGYRGVNVVDFSKCWRNGLAFCAVIHRFKPDLIGNFDSLNPDDIRANCKKAFDAAATLGVPKLIDPEEMVIMVVPDKIAVTSYVYNLRAALTGQGLGSSMASSHYRAFTSPWSAPMFQSEDAGRESGSTKSESPSIEDRRKSPASNRSSTTGRSDKSPSPSEQKALMTRNQLMNPFDSDGEDDGAHEKAIKANRQGQPTAPIVPSIQKTPLALSPTSPTPVASPTTPLATSVNGSDTRQSLLSNQNRPIALIPVGGNSSGDRKEDLKRRARMLLQQYQADDKGSPSDVLSPEDEKRRQELKERARQLIEEAQQRPPNVVRISEMIASTNEELWPLRSNRSNVAANSAPATRQTTPEHRQYIAPSVVTREFLQSAVRDADVGAFDRFKRFGSMRTQELTQSINVLSSRFLYQKGRRSASEPKELLARAENGNNSETMESNFAPTKLDDALERDTRTREQILAEIEQLAQRQRILDQNAADVEKRWRKALDASEKELEQSLMNEYLSLLNERNMLTRREAYLNILEQIREHEQLFQGIQSQLSDLMKLEDFEKTELHKRQIDSLMEKLITIVNRRDELAQQLIAHEQGTQEAAELAEIMINQSLPLVSEDQKNCAIM